MVDRRTTVITWGFHVCGSHRLPHINSYPIARFPLPEHLLVLHLREGEGHCENTLSYPGTQWVIPPRGQMWTTYHSATMPPPLILIIEAEFTYSPA